jgi:hypothetical protein
MHMRKLALLGLVAAFALGSLGCALTNYELIRDDEPGEATWQVVKTVNDVKYMTFSQVAFIYSDGADNLFSTIKQDANGDRLIITSNAYDRGPTGNYFFDDTLCDTPDHNCWIAKADDPEIGDVSLFDRIDQPNCLGYRSLFKLLSDTRFYGECGERTIATNRVWPGIESSGLSDQAIFDIVSQGVPVSFAGKDDFLRFDLNADTASLTLHAGGDEYPVVADSGSLAIYVNVARRQAALDLSDVKAFPIVDAYLAAVDQLRADHGLGASFTVSGSLFGHDVVQPSQYQVSFNPGWDSDLVRGSLTGHSPMAPPLRRDRR